MFSILWGYLPNQWTGAGSTEKPFLRTAQQGIALSTGQNQKAWQTFIENYEIPIRKVQDWYNSIVDKQSADAAADSFNKDVLPILKKGTYILK